MLNGSPVGNMYPAHWNNRQVTWQFIPAPNYTGDISIGAIQGAQPYWPAIAVSHLPNGIHGVQYFANGTWSWPGGYQLQLTVTNGGTAPITGWTAGFMFADAAETVASSWNATVTQTGTQLTAVNAGYNGSVAAGARPRSGWWSTARTRRCPRGAALRADPGAVPALTRAA